MNRESHAVDFADLTTPTLRERSRHWALNMLAGYHSILPTTKIQLAKNRVHFLYLHYVFQDEEKGFERLLRWLSQTEHKFISYSEAVERVENGQIDDRYICFSFDDGVANCLTAGKILQQFGAKACFFLNTSTLGDTNQSHQMLVTRTRYGRLPVQYLSWNNVTALLEMGHEIGGHTHNHVDMGLLSQCDLETEVGLNKEILEKRYGPIQHFAWPFGRMQNFSAIARDVVFDAGYKSCASAERGAHIASANGNSFCIHRDNVVAAWPLSHIKYLLSQSISRSSVKTSSWKGLSDL